MIASALQGDPKEGHHSLARKQRTSVGIGLPVADAHLRRSIVTGQRNPALRAGITENFPAVAAVVTPVERSE
jgi:hypothetical protein